MIMRHDPKAQLRHAEEDLSISVCSDSHERLRSVRPQNPFDVGVTHEIQAIQRAAHGLVKLNKLVWC